MNQYPKPPFPKQQQPVPGSQRKMEPYPDCGEQSYKGSGRLAGKIALITGGDSGIGRAVAIAFAREGADVAVAYLDEQEDAEETARWVEQAGRQCLLLPGDLAHKVHCRALVEKTDMPNPTLLAYATTKGAIANFTAGLAQMLGPKNIRVNSVAPGPIWTPLIVSTMPEEKVQNFGGNTPLGRPGQPVEVAPIYVLLASDEGSYITGQRFGVTGGKPIL
ncbi:MAG: SDR family oxidoreductase [Pseudomonas sp.]|uniref:SDR family oxidoreductase n=1 Tax=Pseudomonas sp. TaxID=306 RepID=UPI003D6F0BF5